ncbi:hypothetical protein KAW50_05120 [candidate division WOR-3 bacterium]|nr:hypothetical protein [candidate division WOR-3 bacterium]
MEELIDLEGLPEEVKKLIEPYAKNLIELLSDNLCSIAVFGSATGEDFIPKKSNVNLLVVLKEVELTHLKKCFKLVAQGRKKGIVAPLFLTRRHMETSSDVFPVEFLDMRDSHQVIYGEPVFEGLDIGTENLRLECEEQLKGKLIRLRQVYLEVGANPKAISAVAVESLTSLIPVFRGMLKLVGEEPPRVKRKVIDATSKRFGIEEWTLQKVIDMKAGKAKLEKKDIEDFYGRYIKEIEKLAIAADQIGESK